MTNLRRIARARTPQRVRVLVDVRGAENEPGCLAQLREAGLEVDRVIEGTVVGSIDRDHLSALRGLAEVREVEVATTLHPRGRG